MEYLIVFPGSVPGVPTTASLGIPNLVLPGAWAPILDAKEPDEAPGTGAAAPVVPPTLAFTGLIKF